MLKLKQVYKSFTEIDHKTYIFEDANLDIARNVTLIILGSSGSGKTTFLNIISAIDEIDSGEITIAGKTISNLKDKERAEFRRFNIGFVFQFYNLIPTLNVEENILLSLDLINANNKINKSYALDLTERVGLADRLKSYPDTLSGGEQQRVALVRALAHRPKVLIADEPTGNLDKDNTTKIMRLIREMTKETQAQLILATHNQELIEDGDVLIEIENKKIKIS
ncbi:MAG: ABC transporter ATP-binding protein [Proteobacteria bacterium]|nr:ABC transporter ATP-binding protein [Pseudomonadota bacterium]